jgi:putative membrane protein
MPDKKRIYHNIGLYVRGVAMGAADIVPGISGGTIAFITGIYETLISSIKAADYKALLLLRKGHIRGLWKHINGTFLTLVFLGIFTSIFLFSNLLSYLLDEYPLLIQGFFFGLILASAIVISRRIRSWTAKEIIAGLSATAVAYLITIMTPANTPDDLWFIFIAGSVAILAMILPGISGSFILLLMGKYHFILNAVRDVNITVLAVLAAGCVVGLLLFSRVLSFALEKHHELTIASLAGFMIGSLNMVWPWKTELSSHPSLPLQIGAEVAVLIFLAMVGFLLVFTVNSLFSKQTKIKYAKHEKQ